MSDLTQFDFDSAVRISRVVRAVEDSPFRSKPLEFDGLPPNGRVPRLRLGRTSAYWPKDTVASIELYSGVTPLGVFLDVMNLLRDVEADRWVLVDNAKQTGWVLVAPEKSACTGVAAWEISTVNYSPQHNASKVIGGGGGPNLPAIPLSVNGCVSWMVLADQWVITGIRASQNGRRLIIDKTKLWVLKHTNGQDVITTEETDMPGAEIEVITEIKLEGDALVSKRKKIFVNEEEDIADAEIETVECAPPE